VQDIAKLNEEALMVVRQNLGLDAHDPSRDDEIAQMPWELVFYHFLEFFRIHGYIGSILNCLRDLGATFPNEE
jgi:hypothetical protein